MAMPGGSLFDLDADPPAFVQYNDLEHVKLYRSFLENPESYINRL
jgi:predicted ATPase